jgi:hypothetical protein
MKFLDLLLQRLPASQARLVARAGSLLIGVFLAVALHYVLYRIGLPSKPFIYVAF